MELRIRPKSDYLHNASCEDLYLLTEFWKSEIEFYRIESRFLRMLVDKYFIWLIKDGNIEKVQSLSNKLSKITKHKKELFEKMNLHLKHLEELIENPFSHDETEFRDEHSKLEDEFTEFVKNFKTVKQEIFVSAEHVIEDEKLHHLLTM